MILRTKNMTRFYTNVSANCSHFFTALFINALTPKQTPRLDNLRIKFKMNLAVLVTITFFYLWINEFMVII